MRSIIISALLLSLLCITGCAGGPQPHARSKGELPEGYEPTKLKPDQEDVPEEVRAIETAIDTKSALIAENVEIYVSPNYEWDVALSGDMVSPQAVQPNQEIVSVAQGNPRATFRNLEIKAWNSIIFRKSTFDVAPFIKVTAKGRAALAVEARNGAPLKVQRADIIKIDNANIELQNSPLMGNRASGSDGVSVAGSMQR